MSESREVPQRTRPGGRSARIRDAVLATTIALLEQTGVAELSVKQIATAAGVAETTIYRRWGSLPGVVSSALSQLAVSENPIPDTGSLEGDLEQILRNVTTIFERPSLRRIFRFTMSMDGEGEESARARTQFWQARFDAGTAVVLRAIERGEIAPLADPQLVVETLVGTAYVRTFLLERPLDDAVLTASVRAAMRTAHAAD